MGGFDYLSARRRASESLEGPSVIGHRPPYLRALCSSFRHTLASRNLTRNSQSSRKWQNEKYSHNGDLSSYVQTATQEIFKAVTARYSAPDLIAERAKVSADINDALRTKLAVYGAQVISIDMRGFAFSPSYMAAINEKVTQEQLRLVAENKLLTVEAEQKQKVAIAEAEASAVRAKADGDAYANLKIATAQADALKVQNAALTQAKDVLELRRIEVEQTKADRWNGVLPAAIYAGAPIPFLNVEK